MRNSTRNTVTLQRVQTEGEKVADNIDLTPAKLHDYGGRFLYYPTQMQTSVAVQSKSTEEYLQAVRPDNMFSKPGYEKEELIFDSTTKKWRLIPQSEMYKYQT